jgi:hypothetical protein
MKPYLLLLVLCCCVAGAMAQQEKLTADEKTFVEFVAQQDKMSAREKAQLEQLLLEHKQLTKKIVALRNKATRESFLVDSFALRLADAQQQRKDYGTTLTKERRKSADSLDRLVTVRTHQRDSLQHVFDRHLVSLDSAMGELNKVRGNVAKRK